MAESYLYMDKSFFTKTLPKVVISPKNGVVTTFPPHHQAHLFLEECPLLVSSLEDYSVIEFSTSGRETIP